MGVDMIAEAGADGLRAQMAEQLAAYPELVTEEILAAVRAVPRHLFLPGVPLRQAYSLGSVVTHRDEHGVALSSATGLTVVASMLKQLDVRPGHRVLEIGSGTGYNAALLRRLVGPAGSVTTIDILPEAATETGEHLAAAGIDGVTVVLGDGELGVPEHGPYDRIIVTAGASDLPPAWADQLVPGGRLVVPLRINGVTRNVALEYDGGIWRGTDMDECGFMPMRGPGQTAEHNLPLRGDTGLVVRTDGGLPLQAALLDGVLEHPAVVVWTKVLTVVFKDLDFWLAQVPGFCRVIMMDRGVEAGLVAPMYDWGSMGTVSEDSLAYLTTGPAGDGVTLQLGVCAYGPNGSELMSRLIGRIEAWDREMNRSGDRLWIEVRPHDSADLPEHLVQVRRRYHDIVVGRSVDEHSAG